MSLSRLRNEQGFTLIELLIVIVVLGILSTIVLFAVGDTKNKADTAKSDSDTAVCIAANAAAQARYGTGYNLDNVNSFLATRDAGKCPVAVP